MKLFKYLGKGIYEEIPDEQLVRLTSDELTDLREVPIHITGRKPKNIFETIGKITSKNGYKVITVMNLVRLLGNKKRSPQIIKKITEDFEKNNLYIYPELTMNLKPDEILRIYTFPVKALGDFFDTENELECFIEENDLFENLGLSKPVRQYSPDQTRDRFDFKCVDTDGNEVALELKNLDGGKSAVEQVLRYMGMLKQQFKVKKVRGVLVTGIRGVDTAKALHGTNDEQKKSIDWYLYSFNKNTQHLTFEKVEYEFIEKHLQPAGITE